MSENDEIYELLKVDIKDEKIRGIITYFLQKSPPIDYKSIAEDLMKASKDAYDLLRAIEYLYSMTYLTIWDKHVFREFSFRILEKFKITNLFYSVTLLSLFEYLYLITDKDTKPLILSLNESKELKYIEIVFDKIKKLNIIKKESVSVNSLIL
ncbi:hypothetical protein [Acidianus sp. HS-5]|uniref:hypothetical protein n=1 Tax=Acidianus sp. HS-5 TaxID=2886040 RepID=UPI001F44C47B|nr:hypothetical protein [Acidianus sp. HS-5]BDC18592.1 hypothetical protein HS5_14820 [Acidianus sp. HS-5]